MQKITQPNRHLPEETSHQTRLGSFTFDGSSHHQPWDAAFTPATLQDSQHTRANTDCAYVMRTNSSTAPAQIPARFARRPQLETLEYCGLFKEDTSVLGHWPQSPLGQSKDAAYKRPKYKESRQRATQAHCSSAQRARRFPYGPSYARR